MKKLLLTAMLLSSTSYANMYVKGGIGMYSGTDTTYDRRANQFSSTGSIEETEIDDQGIGFNLGLGYNFTDSFSVELDLEKDAISMLYGIGFNVRLFKYNKLSLFTKAGISMVMYDNDILSNEKGIAGFNYTYEMTETEAMKFSLGLSVEYDITEKYSVYTSLEYAEYSDITANYFTGGMLTGGPIEVSISQNTKMSVGVKYKF